jgi:hypothetical protein
MWRVNPVDAAYLVCQNKINKMNKIVKIVKMLVELEVFGRVNRLETMCLFILVANLHWEFPFDGRLNVDKFIFDWMAYD